MPEGRGDRIEETYMPEFTKEQMEQIRRAVDARTRYSGLGTYEHEECKEILRILEESRARPINSEKLVERTKA